MCDCSTRDRDDNSDPAELTFAPSPPKYPPPRTQLPALLISLGAFCQGCGRAFGYDVRLLDVDHMVPKSKGGTDAYDNLTLLCGPCNRRKGSRMTLAWLRDWNRRRGILLAKNEGSRLVELCPFYRSGSRGCNSESGNDSAAIQQHGRT